jgi:hypothetical protein
MKPKKINQLRLHFKKNREEMNNYSRHKSAMEISVPILLIPDKIDAEVPVTLEISIYNHF